MALEAFGVYLDFMVLWKLFHRSVNVSSFSEQDKLNGNFQVVARVSYSSFISCLHQTFQSSY